MRFLALVLVLTSGLSLPTVTRAEFVAEKEDFKCLTDGVKIDGKHFYVFHRNKQKLRKAARIARRDRPNRRYPVGTIIQLFPFEAMVKRGGRFNPEGGGWEYFTLSVTRDGATITSPRPGDARVTNLIGSCMDARCHLDPGVKAHDFICEGHGGGSLGLSEALIELLQKDARCQ